MCKGIKSLTLDKHLQIWIWAWINSKASPMQQNATKESSYCKIQFCLLARQ